jgi:hypothetical protein
MTLYVIGTFFPVLAARNRVNTMGGEGLIPLLSLTYNNHL